MRSRVYMYASARVLVHEPVQILQLQRPLNAPALLVAGDCHCQGRGAALHHQY